MDLGKLNRNAEDRSVVWAAVATAALGVMLALWSIVQKVNGRMLDFWTAVVFSLVFFALAYAIRRGSRAAAVAVVTLFLLNAVLTVLFVGVSLATLAFFVILGGMLWAGMRGVFAQAARAPRSAPRPGSPA